MQGRISRVKLRFEEKGEIHQELKLKNQGIFALKLTETSKNGRTNHARCLFKYLSPASP